MNPGRWWPRWLTLARAVVASVVLLTVLVLWTMFAVQRAAERRLVLSCAGGLDARDALQAVLEYTADDLPDPSRYEGQLRAAIRDDNNRAARFVAQASADLQRPPPQCATPEVLQAAEVLLAGG